jgi:hypothetical protein
VRVYKLSCDATAGGAAPVVTSLQSSAGVPGKVVDVLTAEDTHVRGPTTRFAKRLLTPCWCDQGGNPPGYTCATEVGANAVVIMTNPQAICQVQAGARCGRAHRDRQTALSCVGRHPGRVDGGTAGATLGRLHQSYAVPLLHSREETPWCSGPTWGTGVRGGRADAESEPPRQANRAGG